MYRYQFGINLHLWVFQKAEIARAASASAISILVIAVYMRSLAYKFLNVFLQIIIQNYDV